MKTQIMMGLTMGILGMANEAAAGGDLSALAAARGIGRVETAEVRGAGDCPVVLSIDPAVTGPAATRGAAHLAGGWVLGGADGALLKVLDACARPDTSPSQLAAIVAAMAAETPLTPILANADAMVRDRLAAVNRGWLAPESTQSGDTVRLTFQALAGETAAPAAVTLDWTPGGAASVQVTSY